MLVETVRNVPTWSNALAISQVVQEPILSSSGPNLVPSMTFALESIDAIVDKVINDLRLNLSLSPTSKKDLDHGKTVIAEDNDDNYFDFPTIANILHEDCIT